MRCHPYIGSCIFPLPASFIRSYIAIRRRFGRRSEVPTIAEVGRLSANSPEKKKMKTSWTREYESTRVCTPSLYSLVSHSMFFYSQVSRSLVSYPWPSKRWRLQPHISRNGIACAWSNPLSCVRKQVRGLYCT